MSKLTVTAAAVVALVSGIGSYAAFLAATPSADSLSVSSPTGPSPVPSSPNGPVWTETGWPFPVDQWGGGWAFQCKAADCGTDVNLYLRPKIGFCNCQTGVADDEELDRVSDLDLIGGAGSALGPGQPILVHWMKGRSRGYRVAGPSAKPVLSFAFNDRCDVIVATVLAGNEPFAQEQAVLEFLNSDLVRTRALLVLEP